MSKWGTQQLVASFVRRRVLVVGGSFSGLAAGRDLAKHFLAARAVSERAGGAKVTIIDAKEHFEYTPGILRAFVKPKHLDALSFTLQPVIEDRMGCKFVWGEVKTIDGAQKLIKYHTHLRQESGHLET